MGSLPQSKSASAPKDQKAAEFKNVDPAEPPSSQEPVDPFSFPFSQGEVWSQETLNVLTERKTPEEKTSRGSKRG